MGPVHVGSLHQHGVFGKSGSLLLRCVSFCSRRRDGAYCSVTPRLEHLFDTPLSRRMQAVEASKLTVEQISSVELVGGSSRVPAVLRVFKDFFGKEPSRTLNAKEAVSRGCALQCAMLSPIFR